MQDKMNLNYSRPALNLAAARYVCDLVYNSFDTLNKPTHSEMVFKQRGGDISNIQEIVRFVNGTVLGILTSGKDWQDLSERNKDIIEKINKHIAQKCTFEYFCLTRSVDFSGKQEQLIYLSNLLIMRINCTVLEFYCSGKCSELIVYATMLLLNNDTLLQPEFNLEILQLTSDYLHTNGQNYGHLIGVIDRDLNSSIDDPSLWGESAVILDPWNQGNCFNVNEIGKYDYYKHGNWKYKVAYSFKLPRLDNIVDKEFLIKYNYLAKYILKVPLPMDSFGYVIDALKKFDAMVNLK